MRQSIWKPVALATLVCGTLDILFAVILALLRGKEPAAMLRFVASGPFPQATDWGATGSVLGLAVHYALMAIMATILVLIVRRRPELLATPWRTGIAYGLVTYVAMNLIVVQLRFHPAFPPKTLSIVTQLFAHLVLVGIPMTLIARRYLRRGAA
jgi:hypothetical protein